MGKRVTPDRYHELAKSKGGQCLRIARTTTDKSLWRCAMGHEWEARYSDISHCGSWCRICSGNAPVPPEKYHQIAFERGGKCLRVASKSLSKALWECEFGHQWEARYNNVSGSGSWCPHCSGHVGVPNKKYHLAAKKKGGLCLLIGRTTHDKSLWECNEGHRWEATYNSVANRGTWCLICAGKSPIPESVYHKLAQENNGSCLKVARSTSHNALWRCNRGHTWLAPYGSVSNGAWCQRCHLQKVANSKRLDESAYHNIAAERGGKCLRPAGDVMTGALWQCSKGHRWEARYNNIASANSWCPFCKSSNGEDAVEKVLSVCGIPHKREVAYNKCRNPKTGYKLRFDFEVTIDNTIILIEFNGMQHYRKLSNNFFGGERALLERQYRDRVKKNFCKQNNIPLIVVNYNVNDVADYLLRRLSKATGLDYGDLLVYGRKFSASAKYEFVPGTAVQLNLFGGV